VVIAEYGQKVPKVRGRSCKIRDMTNCSQIHVSAAHSVRGAVVSVNRPPVLVTKHRLCLRIIRIPGGPKWGTTFTLGIGISFAGIKRSTRQRESSTSYQLALV
jgi:hypothetical protein